MSDENTVLVPKGFRTAAVKAGIKPSGGLDLAVFVSDQPCSAAGTFTTNRVRAAPVRWDRDLVPSRAIRAIVVNSGNANAATGEVGLRNVGTTASFTAKRLDCLAEQVLVCSTGVIGRQLPMENLLDGLTRALDALSPEPSRFQEASRAIMTTDTRPKLVSVRRRIAGREITLLGLAKGAAMIGPRMATMLGFLLTDAVIEPIDLRGVLSNAVDLSFNCISVEGHASTNDTVLMLASGESGGEPLRDVGLAEFGELVSETCVSLAKMIPEDGEGATHLITIDVAGAASREQARLLARAVADSPLVKAAIHGGDPNWGRIVSAAGYSGVTFEEEEVSLTLNGVHVYRDGAPLDFDAAELSRKLKAERETSIRLSFKQGSESIRFWTCDLTAEYVRLNADYTT